MPVFDKSQAHRRGRSDRPAHGHRFGRPSQPANIHPHIATTSPGQAWPIEINLTSTNMLFPMLLGGRRCANVAWSSRRARSCWAYPPRLKHTMKLAILSRNNKLYSTRRLVAAARERSHTVRVLDPLRCYMKIAPGQFQLHYKGKSLTGIEAVIPRIGASVTRYGTAVLRQLELMGAYTPNSSRRDPSCPRQAALPPVAGRRGSRLADDRIRRQPGRYVRPAGLAGQAAACDQAGRGLPGQRRGACRALRARATSSTPSAACTPISWSRSSSPRPKGADMRCFVVGDNVVAAMRRQGEPGEFRSNLHRGGSADSVKLTAVERETALRAAKGPGPGSRRRRPAALAPRPVGAGGELLAGPGGDRGRDRGGRGRGNHRLLAARASSRRRPTRRRSAKPKK